MTSETQINDLKLSADGSLLYAAMGTTVRMWDLERWVTCGPFSKLCNFLGAKPNIKNPSPRIKARSVVDKPVNIVLLTDSLLSYLQNYWNFDMKFK